MVLGSWNKVAASVTHYLSLLAPVHKEYSKHQTLNMSPLIQGWIIDHTNGAIGQYMAGFLLSRSPLCTECRPDLG